MDIQQLRFFVAAAECGNMVSAASRCNISQSGLSRSIAHLEERLGVPLLIRRSRGVDLSPYGRVFLRRARLILNEFSHAVSELKSLDWAGAGEIVVGVTQNYGHYLVPDVLARLIETIPGDRLVIRTGGYLDLLKDLREGATDLVFGLIGPLEEAEGLCVERLREHHSRVLARPGHPLAREAGEIDGAKLSVARWATLASVGFQLNFSRYFLAQNLPPPPQVLITDSIPLIRAVVMREDLLTVLPPGAASAQLDTGDLVILDCDAPGEETDVGLVTRASGIATPQLRLLQELLRAGLSPGGLPPRTEPLALR